MYINSNHIKILNIIKHNNNVTFEHILPFFKLSSQQVKNYIFDIYQEISPNEKNPNLNSIILKIYNSKNLKQHLRKKQEFTKEEKIYYIAFNILLKKHVTISSISRDLEVTKRGLNYYFSEVNKILLNSSQNCQNIKLKISTKGVQLIASKNTINSLTFSIFFKLLIEKDTLPTKFRSLLIKYIRVESLYRFKKDCGQLCETFNHKLSIYSLYFFIALVATSSQTSARSKIRDIPLKELSKYNSNSIFDESTFKKIFLYLKKSELGNLPKENIVFLLSGISSMLNLSDKYPKDVISICTQIRPIIYKYLDENIYNNPNYFKLIAPWVQLCIYRELFSIDDFNFLKFSFDLNEFKTLNFIEMTEEISKILPKFSFYESIIFWCNFSKKESLSNEFDYFLVYNNIPNHLIENIVNKLEKKYPFKIKKSITLANLKNHSFETKKDKIITLEKMRVFIKNIELINLPFPI